MVEQNYLLFWGFLIVFGIIMFMLSPRALDTEGFFKGRSKDGRDASGQMLMLSIFISWIFAKSVTNAANLGEKYGIIGGLAYATYWLSIPFAGWIIYRLRTRHGATGLLSFLEGKYGRLASLAFATAILVRLFNEVWSNTSVVGGYYGEAGSWPFIGAAMLFTAMVLFYSLKGGLRSSIFTDAIQAVIFVFFLAIVLLIVLPKNGITNLASQGNFALSSGGDLLLVAMLQIFSYPFHDPVLTDRGFITREKTMLKAFIVAGLLGFVAILAFSLVGIHARLEGIAGNGNVPASAARGLGFIGFFAMIAVMVSSAASTLDSTFSSLAKAIAIDLPRLAGLDIPANAVRHGLIAMIIFAIIGNVPMFVGTDILKATTVSGTMVIGLAPIFMLAGLVNYSPLSFHLSFWCGMTIGILQAIGALPALWTIGTGSYGNLLGANLYGLALCFAVFLLPLILGMDTKNTRRIMPT